MLESFNISHECYNCLGDKDQVTKTLHKKLVAYDRKIIRKSVGQMDQVAYELGIQQVVRRVLDKSDPKIAHLVDARVMWAIKDRTVDTTIHIHLSNAYRHSLYVQNYSTTVH